MPREACADVRCARHTPVEIPQHTTASPDDSGGKRSARPGTPEFRAALRDALEQTKELVGTQGVYTMTPQDHSGFDRRGRELMQLKNGAWQRID